MNFEVIYMQVDYKIMYVTRRENLYHTHFDIPCLAYGSYGKHLALAVVEVVNLGFTTLLTSQVISIAFYGVLEKSDKFCSEAQISY